jgi:plastocyanin
MDKFETHGTQPLPVDSSGATPSFIGRAACALAIVVPMLAVGPSKAAPGTVVIAAPGGIVTGFATTTMVLPQGTTLQLFNPDPLTPHNVVSKATRKVKAGGRYVKVPLFLSSYAGTGGLVPVVGTEKLKPGSYPFYCALHPVKMTGTLIVQ